MKMEQPLAQAQIDADLSSYKIDIGIQYPIQLGKNDVLTPGITYDIGHAINSPAHYYSYVANGDTTKSVIEKAFELPTSFGVGLAWAHKEQWKIGLDVTHQRWGECRVPQIINDKFVSTTENYMNRTKIVIGGEFQPDRYSNKYLRRVQYRAGASLPVSNNINNRSVVNIAFQWGRSVPGVSSLITENYLRLNVGITFNERWFMKWKIQ